MESPRSPQGESLTGPPAPRRHHRILRWLVVAYLILLGVSHVVRLRESKPGPLPEGLTPASVSVVRGSEREPSEVRLAYRDLGDREQVAVVLLHGSPGSGNELTAIGAALSRDYRALIPDLPGFGHSERDLPDYSSRAHAGYVLQLLEQLGISSAHVVGFSLGGAVGIELYDLAPERVRSLTLLSATGVQEFELLGSYHMNHLVHGAQLAFLWALREAVPHMGRWDASFFGVAYARNFFDTDQRPLRAVLQRFEPPMLIVHGKQDVLVPPGAALEHHRIVPQSELLMLEDNHFMTFLRPGKVAAPIAGFLHRVDAGGALHRESADPNRLQAASRPFDPAALPPATGPTLLAFFLLIIVATFVSEDLTCIGVGLMVAQGQLGLLSGMIACFIGIFLGDLLLYFTGRVLGRSVVSRAPFRWLIREEQIEAASAWFNQRGAVVVGLGRFMPGARLPTYVTAGVLRTGFWQFALWFFLAAAVWTPLLVGVATVVGEESLALFESSGTAARWVAVGVAVGLLVLVRVGVGLLSHRGRRLLVSCWRRIVHWEFWPPWLFYPPVVLYGIGLGIRFRSFTVFTATNPGMPAGGFIGESKSEILAGLETGGAPVAPFRCLHGAWTVERRRAVLREFMAERELNFPVVLKPDTGERGAGVAVIRSDQEASRYLDRHRGEVLVQQHIPGRELGVFYVRHPQQGQGRIFSITDKRMPKVIGDGHRTLERLILDDPRAVCMARTYLAAQSADLRVVPSAGEERQLVELGTHCRGAIFLDGGKFKTEALERVVDGWSRGTPGFFFGRYDLRAPSGEHFREGRGISIIELNGVTSESTDIYDPGNSLWSAYQVLFRQWRLAFRIGDANRRSGTPLTSLTGLARMWWKHRS